MPIQATGFVIMVCFAAITGFSGACIGMMIMENVILRGMNDEIWMKYKYILNEKFDRKTTLQSNRRLLEFGIVVFVTLIILTALAGVYLV